MEFQIVNEARNELLSRRELRFVLTYDGPTPSRKEILARLCAEKNVNPALAALDSLKTKYGMMQAEGAMRIYDTEEGRSRAEPAYLLSRGEPKQEEA